MKTLTILFTHFLLISNSLFSQGVFEDARSISNLGKLKLDDGALNIKIDFTNKEKAAAIVEILEAYYPSAGFDDKMKPADIEVKVEDLVGDNPYIAITGLTESSDITTKLDLAGARLNLDKAYSAALTSASGVNVTSLADGLAKFIVERAKEELTVSFFKRFKDKLEAQKELAALFPTTAQVLRKLDTEIYKFDAYITTLRESFQMDLANIYRNLNNVLESDRVRQVLKQYPELEGMLRASLYLIERVEAGTHPGKIISGFQPSLAEKIAGKNAKAAVETLQLLSESLKATNQESAYWVSPFELEESFSDPNFIYLYLGLLYEKANKEQIIYADGTEFKTVIKNLKSVSDGLLSCKNLVMRISREAHEMDQYIAEIKSTNGQKKFDSFHALFGSMLDFMDLTHSIVDLPNLQIALPINLKRFVGVGRNMSDLYLNAKEQKYSMAVLNLTSILDTISAFDSGIDLGKVSSSVLKYGTFMANIAQAENSDQVKEAIEATVLPPGSANIKKETCLSFGIQSYVGANMLDIPDRTNYARHNGKTGFYAPVGLASNVGLFKKKPYAFSVGLFATAVDIGSLAQFRLNNTSGSIESDIALGNILSPGLHGVLGLPAVPISVGVGYYAQPLLQSVDAMGNTILSDQNPGFGWHTFLAVDIPLFNLYVRP
jgi:hypothetical protein